MPVLIMPTDAVSDPAPTTGKLPAPKLNALDEALQVRNALNKISAREDKALQNMLFRYKAEREVLLAEASDAAKAILEAAEKASR